MLEGTIPFVPRRTIDSEEARSALYRDVSRTVDALCYPYAFFEKRRLTIRTGCRIIISQKVTDVFRKRGVL